MEGTSCDVARIELLSEGSKVVIVEVVGGCICCALDLYVGLQQVSDVVRDKSTMLFGDGCSVNKVPP